MLPWKYNMHTNIFINKIAKTWTRQQQSSVKKKTYAIHT